MRKKTDYNALGLLISIIALAGAAPPVVITLGGIIGQDLAPDPHLATLPVTIFSVGMALASLPVSAIMRRFGRRVGFLCGASLLAIGGTFALGGLYWASFTLFCLATLAIGLANGTTQFVRYTAADFATQQDRPKVISWVMTGGVAAAIIGPQINYWFLDSLPGLPSAGPFLVVALLSIPVVFLLFSIKFPPAPQKEKRSSDRSLKAMITEKNVLAAIVCGAVSFGMMSLVMTAAPLAMHAHHHAKTDAVLAIQWHVLAMYVPSFFTGTLIVRYGVKVIIGLGLIMTFLAALLAVSGTGLFHFWSSLIMLGLGWNFGFIGSTALLTRSYRSEEKNTVEGINDFLTFSSTALCSLGAGVLLGWQGWDVVNFVVFPTTALALLVLTWSHKKEKLAKADSHA